MSWEGYAQVFCKNGHLHGNWDDTYFYSGDADATRSACPACGAPPGYENVVDDTNCDQQGILTDEVLKTLLISPEETATCSLGHTHVTKAAVYRIPTKKEAKELCSFWDETKGVYVRLKDHKGEW